MKNNSGVAQGKQESSKGFLGWIEAVGNKMSHPLEMFLWIIGTVVVLATASGFAERVGFFKTVIQMFLSNKKGNTVVFIAALFKGVKRYPVAGLVLGFAPGIGSTIWL